MSDTPFMTQEQYAAFKQFLRNEIAKSQTFNGTTYWSVVRENPISCAYWVLHQYPAYPKKMARFSHSPTTNTFILSHREIRKPKGWINTYNEDAIATYCELFKLDLLTLLSEDFCTPKT